MILVSDTETNGFLENLDRIHCVVIKDRATGKAHGYADQPGHDPIVNALDRLAEADEVIGHNFIHFDYPALQKVYPRFKMKGRIRDTLVESRLIWTDLFNDDEKLVKRGKLPGRLTGLHKLEAWGYRLGKLKGEFGVDPKTGKDIPGIWDVWTPEMQSYMMQDGEVTDALATHINRQNYSAQAIELEHRFAEIISLMTRRGIRLDIAGATKLYEQLVKERLTMTKELLEAFPPKVVEEAFVSKSNNRKMGYVKGETFIKRREVPFNPSSRQMIADRLKGLGWQPAAFTPSGQPKVDETILSKLPFPQAKVLARYFLIEKRIAQLAEGDQAWLRLEKNGLIHHSMNPNGTPTGRCTHSRPNIAQTPKVGSAFGAECRVLFMPTVFGWKLVGVDLSGIELRCLAHYMARYDGGAYVKTVVEGKESEGTDVHSVNARALGLDPKKVYLVEGKQTTGRNLAKTFIYAFLYGAGDEKIGSIVGVTEEEMLAYRRTRSEVWTRIRDRFVKDGRDPQDVYGIARTIKGGDLRVTFMKGLPALKKLIDAVKKKAKDQKFLIGLDGRRIHVRSAHSALNSLLQTAGAVIAKQATVFAWDNLTATGYAWGRDWALLLHVHDELQTETRKEIADEVGNIIIASMRQCGPHFDLRVPIDGGSKAGDNWRDTH